MGSRIKLFQGHLLESLTKGHDIVKELSTDAYYPHYRDDSKRIVGGSGT